jgi:hypothetical protein
LTFFIWAKAFAVYARCFGVSHIYIRETEFHVWLHSQKPQEKLILIVTESASEHSSTCHCILFFTQFAECTSIDCK